MNRARFQVDWYSGASAQLELIPAEQEGSQDRLQNYNLKYTPPFRTTIRPPIEKDLLNTDVLEPIGRKLDKMTVNLVSRATRRPRVGRATAIHKSSQELDIQRLGNQLFQLLVPRKFQGDLRTGGRFLEIGMEQTLLNYPWELMHDGDDFLCLKHYFGRFVNSKQLEEPARPRESSISGSENLSVLVISVPEPDRDTTEFDELPGAEAETRAISEALDALKRKRIRFSLVKDENATFDNVWDALNDNYQIIHFIGHATYNEKDPFRSALALYDRDMTSMEVVACFGKNPPVLCFMNACETARTGSPGSRVGKPSQNIYGLAEAFLRTGAYLLGSRWKLGDAAAASFSKRFYKSLLGNGRSIGSAITEARKACKDASPDDPFSWASYIFYGDPRLYFRRILTTERE